MLVCIYNLVFKIIVLLYWRKCCEFYEFSFVWLIQDYYSALVSIAISHRILLFPHVDEVSVRSKYYFQYFYRKCGTHARVFSKTFAHGNGKKEI